MTNTDRHHDSGRIVLKDLVKEFQGRDGATRAVDGINLETEPGEFVTLLGPSGCGKTTTLRMVAGFETPTSGDILLDGADMTRLTPDKRPMSMVFQSYALFPHLSVRDNVAYGLKLQKMTKAAIDEAVDSALTSMDLVKLANRAPNQLSGGQQQRVALARAMVMRPKVLLFDEPLSNLDAKLRVQMRTEIRNLQQKLGITALYVTHDQDEAMSLSDRIVVMNKGRIEQIGTPDEIYRRPATVFVADFIGSANFLDPAGVTVLGDRARVDVLGSQRELNAAAGAAAASSHVVLVRPESVHLRRSSVDAPEGELVTGSRGRVLRAVFYGSVVEYEIDTDAGTIIAVVSDPDPDGILAEDELVEVDFPRDRGWLLPA
ncbi:ABC transporter ATP-binding protein [Propioniciclava coleopterorum]|uniref:ABC transporter ATP-binding protein n=1 Tax=Propioniciclava coleopterorum TaxID=2714937 RepID=A0A6G7Y4X5_9ACTN|nr:ABC transporter ATP-binding protein [Propioniciclava coleopterorum]QIK71870.1 ABC transporter ATP-binding protein [Propioniciclava coleopterorum]